MKTKSLLSSLKRSKDVLYIIILALVVALVWIVLGVYHAATKTSITADVKKLTLTLNPSIDTETLQQLTSRTMFTTDELATFPINREIIDTNGTTTTGSVLPASPTPTPTPAGTSSGTLATPTPAPSPSPSPTPTP